MIMDADKKKDLFLSLVKHKASVEEVLQKLSSEGITPNLIFHEEDKTWGIVSKGISTTKPSGEFYDVAFYLYGKKEGFKPDITSAVLHYLWPEDFYEDDDVIVKPDKTFFLKPKLNNPQDESCPEE
jgi:hypothetical protein